jgi:ATP-dependent DNA helicase RecG
LRDLGLLEQQDRGAATYYTPAEKLLIEAHGFGGKPAKATEKPAMRQEKPRKLPEKPRKLPEKPRKLPEKPRKLPEGEKAALPRDLAEAVEGLNRWTPQPELRRLIVRLCAWSPLTSEELSHLLDRSRPYLQTAYLGPLLKEGRLEYSNPAKPHDPNQRYRAPDGWADSDE